MADNNLNCPALICVDWGSTNFRAFLLDANGNALEQLSSGLGMLSLAKNEFENALLSQIGGWLQDRNLPVLMAGMVGSAQGWYDAGYLNCPGVLSDIAKGVCHIPNSANLDVAIVPGLSGLSSSGQDEVMRGEEVQILGASQLLQDKVELGPTERVFCLPGTHSKWAQVSSVIEPVSGESLHTVDNFSTQMTGEVFSLLMQYSILGRTTDKLETSMEISIRAFDEGLTCGFGRGGLLHNLFSARSKVITGSLAANEARSYLSGILIGAELAAAVDAMFAPDSKAEVYLIGGGHLTELYQRGLLQRGVIAHCIAGDVAACCGLYTIAVQSGMLTIEGKT